MRNLTFTLYSTAKTNKGKPVTLSWDKWCSDYFINQHKVRPGTQINNKGETDYIGKDGPAILLGSIPVGAVRASENVTQIHALGIDIEHADEQRVEAVLQKLAPFEFALWTSHRHGTPGEPHPRLRILLPLSEPHDGEIHKKEVWPRLQAFINQLGDKSTKDPSRLFYLPSTWRAPEGDDNDPFSYRNSGRWITLADLPEVSAREQKVASDFVVKSALNNLRQKLLKEPKTNPYKEGINRLLAGESFAPEKGTRHDFILAVTWAIADRMPETPPEAVMELFAKSLSVMDTDQTVDAVRDAYLGALDKVEEVKEEKAAERKAKALASQLDGQEPYTPEDLKTIAANQGWDDAEAVKKRLIVQADSTFYIMQEDGFYSQPFSYMEARPAAARLLARAPVVLNEPTKSSMRRKPIQELVEDAGVQCKHLIADLTIQNSIFEPATRTMREAVAPWRNLEPTYDPDIENWLRALSPDDAHFEKLMNWLACAPDLSKTLCAIYLAGESGGGKTLLAKGLAKIWTEGGCAEIHRILKDNNAELTKCPVILADEAVPKRWQGNPTTTILRSMISDTTRTLARKYKSPADLMGAVRLIIAANSEHLLNDADDAPGKQDREAVGQRFLCIEVGTKATKFIESIEKKYSIQEKWLDQDGIAKFCLYLNQTRPVEREGRFWVMGVMESQMARRAASGGSDWNAWTTEFLVRYLLSPNAQDVKGNGLIRRGEGQLLVNGQALVDGWNQYLRVSKRDPDSVKIGMALGAISGKKVQRMWQGRRMWYYPIKMEYLIDWITRTGFGDEETIRKAVAGSMTSEPAGPTPAAAKGTAVVKKPVAKPVAKKPLPPKRRGGAAL